MTTDRPLSAHSWRAHLLILFLLFFLAPIHMIPFFSQLSTHIAGDVMDTAEYPLDEWWTAHALSDLKTNPFYNDLFFFPLGENMVQHTYTFLDGLFFTLLRPFIPLILFHNLLICIIFFANGVAAYLLFFYCLRIPWLAFLGSLAFAHSPTLMSYYKTASLLEVYNFVFFVFFSYSFVRQQHIQWAVPAGLFWGLTLYNYPYYFVFGGLWLAILLGYHLCPWKIEMRSPEEIKVSPSAYGLLGIAFLGIILFPVLTPRSLGEWLIRRRLINWGNLTLSAFLLYGLWTGFKWQAIRKYLKRNKHEETRGNFYSCFTLLLKTFPIRWNPPEARSILAWLCFSGLSLAIASLVGFPFFWSYLNDEATRVAVGSIPSDFANYSVDLVSFFAPFNNWLAWLYPKIASNWVSGRPIIGTPAFLGYGFMVILFLGIKQFFRRPDLRLWIIAWLFFSVLCLGPFLKVHGLIIDSLPLPAYWIRFVPVLESARTLSRYLAPTMLLLCLLICLILKPLYIRSRPWGRKMLLMGLFLIIGFEYGLLPYPLPMGFSDYRVPEVYKILAQRADGRTGLLLDLPLLTHSGTRSEGKGVTRQLYYQTVHQQKMIGGVSSKLDESVFVFFRNQPAIAKLWSFQPVAEPELAALIFAYDINWIVLNKRYYAPEILQAYRSVIKASPYMKPFYEDAGYLGIAIDQDSAILKQKALHYWKGPNALSGLIYPWFTGPLKSDKIPPLTLIIPTKLWNHLVVSFSPETIKAFSGLKLHMPDHKEIAIPFPPSDSLKETKALPLTLRRVFPLTEFNPSVVRVVFSPEQRRHGKETNGFPFPFSILSLGKASGFLSTPSQVLVKNQHFIIDQDGITAFHLSERGKVLEKAHFQTDISAQAAQDLVLWLKNFPQKEYLLLLAHHEGGRYVSHEVSEALRAFGAKAPVEKGDLDHSYVLLGRKGNLPGRIWEAHAVSGPAFVFTPGQALQISDIGLYFP